MSGHWQAHWAFVVIRHQQSPGTSGHLWPPADIDNHLLAAGTSRWRELVGTSRHQKPPAGSGHQQVLALGTGWALAATTKQWMSGSGGHYWALAYSGHH